jgi:ubiquinone/menaquinone biosynthesis C-methylase UbiE
VLRSRAQRRGTELEVTGLDAKIGHLLVGRSLDHRMRQVAAGARHLPFPPGAFDWTLCTLFLHHFSVADARLVLTEMRRVARRGAVVVDLRPSRLASLLFRLLSAALRLGPVASSDGRLSLRQAWSLRDVRALIGNLPVVELRRRFPFRFSLVLEAGC